MFWGNEKLRLSARYIVQEITRRWYYKEKTRENVTRSCFFGQARYTLWAYRSKVTAQVGHADLRERPLSDVPYEYSSVQTAADKTLPPLCLGPVSRQEILPDSKYRLRDQRLRLHAEVPLVFFRYLTPGAWMLQILVVVVCLLPGCFLNEGAKHNIFTQAIR